ncbi:MAG TPA: hypothetical protein VN578_23225, partial [Candidatus Binatia bacterium]|nr:hypothetical protein [Candidatus Binatia bacterium]
MKRPLCLVLLLTAAFCSPAAEPTATLICAPPKTVACGTTWNFDEPGTMTNICNDCCGFYTNILLLSTVTNGTACSNVITRTWGLTNNCFMTNTCSQTVTVLNTNPPVFQAVNNLTFHSCTNLPLFYALDASDCCPV